MKPSNITLARIALAAGISATVSTAAASQPVISEQKQELPKPEKCAAVFEIKAKEVIFAEADANKDGKLSLVEFNKAYAAIVAQQEAKAAGHAPIRPIHPTGRGCPGCGLG